MLPYPEICREWIMKEYTMDELRRAGEYRSLMEAIAKDVCAKHGIEGFDDKLNMLYHVEDIIQEMSR